MKTEFIRSIVKEYFIIIVSVICALFIIIGITSVKDDSVTIDEVAHIVSGYSTLTNLNYNLNIEHPPLVKVISAIPLLFQDIDYKLPGLRMPNQWQEGNKILFESGNNIDDILFWTRFAVLIFHGLLLFVCGVLFKKFLTPTWSLIALFFLAFEPNIFAHSRYVTTDVGIALFSVISLLLTAVFMRDPTHKNALYLGLGLGGVLLTKFSGVLLTLYIFVILLIFSFITYKYDKEKSKNIFKNTLNTASVAAFCVYIVYTFFNINTPISQLRSFVNTSLMPAPIKQLELIFSDYTFTKAIPSYLSGLDYAGNRSIQRSEVTGTQFLDGEYGTMGKGWWYYFPKAWLYKESPAILILTLLGAAILGLSLWKKKKIETALLLMLGFSGLYLLLSLLSTLNIGIRHIAPVLALTPVIGVWIISRWEYAHKYILIGILILTQCVTIYSTYPFYLSYFNDFSGGSLNGYKHLSDSNVDWGQNLKRLSVWAEQQGIDAIYVDYWGKTPLNFYDKKGILKAWHGDWGRPQGIFAIFPVWIEQSKWVKQRGLTAEDYSYLDQLPHTTIGNSIFIYDLR
ncbi:MAG: phospholipid carrier-dependent glycosyltransferase [Candidatus Gracilibacteria bacterium]